jgi:hypothetical protein
VSERWLSVRRLSRETFVYECHRVRLQMSFIKSSGEILIRNSDANSWPRGVSQFLRDDENFPKFAFRQWGVRGGLQENLNLKAFH